MRDGDLFAHDEEPEWQEFTGEEPPKDTRFDALLEPHERKQPGEVEPEPDFTDTDTWIEVRQMLLDDLVESDGIGRPPVIRQMISNRYRVSYRLRKPEEADLPFARLPPVYRKLPEPTVIKGDPWGSEHRPPYPVNHLETKQPTEDYSGSGWRHRRQGGFANWGS